MNKAERLEAAFSGPSQPHHQNSLSARSQSLTRWNPSSEHQQLLHHTPSTLTIVFYDHRTPVQYLSVLTNNLDLLHNKYTRCRGKVCGLPEIDPSLGIADLMIAYVDTRYVFDFAITTEIQAG